MSTVHAHRAPFRDRPDRHLAQATRITAEFATRQVAHHIDLIVQLERRRIRDADGTTRLHRRVQEVIFIEPGEIVSGTYQPAVNTVYLANPDGTHDYGPFPPGCATRSSPCKASTPPPSRSPPSHAASHRPHPGDDRGAR